MGVQSVFRSVLAIASASALAACTGSGGRFPADNLAGTAPAAVPGVRLSWIDPRSKSGTLLYVSDQNAGTVYVYAYPSLAPVGQLTGFDLPSGLCVNRRNGNVWVTDAFANTISEFAHGGSTPIRTIAPGSRVTTYVAACSVHPKSGDLAVVTLETDDPSEILIFKPGQSIPKTYLDYKHAYSMNFDAYEPDGALFADGKHYSGGGPFALEELAKGAAQLSNVPWNGPRIYLPGGVQFDGTDLALGDVTKHVIYRTNGGNVVATVVLKGACDVNGFFIHAGALIAPSACGSSSGQILVYNYPAGGAPLRSLSGFKRPYSAVVSP